MSAAGLLSNGIQHRLLQSVPSAAGFVFGRAQDWAGQIERPGLAELRQSSQGQTQALGSPYSGSLYRIAASCDTISVNQSSIMQLVTRRVSWKTNLTSFRPRHAFYSWSRYIRNSALYSNCNCLRFIPKIFRTVLSLLELQPIGLEQCLLFTCWRRTVAARSEWRW